MSNPSRRSRRSVKKSVFAVSAIGTTTRSMSEAMIASSTVPTAPPSASSDDVKLAISAPIPPGTAAAKSRRMPTRISSPASRHHDPRVSPVLRASPARARRPSSTTA